MSVLKRHVLSLICLLALLCPQAANAHDTIVKFGPVAKADVDTVRQMLVSDPSLTDLLVNDYIRIPEDIQMAKIDLNNDGKPEILLFIKQADQKPCTVQDCRFQIWQQSDGHWDKIGAYLMKEENLHVYDTTSHGLRDIAGSQGVIDWSELSTVR
jgi:hypothetical protein